jgi:hypothetical protein
MQRLGYGQRWTAFDFQIGRAREKAARATVPLMLGAGYKVKP